MNSSILLGSALGNLASVTVTLRGVTVLASLSVSILAENQTAPNLGSAAPFFVTDTAARAVSSSSVSVSS